MSQTHYLAAEPQSCVIFVDMLNKTKYKTKKPHVFRIISILSQLSSPLALYGTSRTSECEAEPRSCFIFADILTKTKNKTKKLHVFRITSILSRLTSRLAS